MTTLVFCLYLMSGTIFAFYIAGWAYFRLRGGHLFRTLKRSMAEINGKQPSYGMSKGECANCNVPVTFDVENSRWKHNDGNDVYHSCYDKKCEAYKKRIHGHADFEIKSVKDDVCPSCGEGFPTYSNIICPGLPLRPKWQARWVKFVDWLSWKQDWIDGYYNHQRFGFTIPNMFLAIGDYCWRRYNVVKCRELSPRWHEPSERMPHVMFELLQQYVEHEDPDVLKCKEEFEPSDYCADWDEETKSHVLESDKINHERRLEIKRLYKWWTITRHEEEKAIEDALMQWKPGDRSDENEAIFRRHMELEDRQSEFQKDAMKRLVEIYDSLWQ